MHGAGTGGDALWTTQSDVECLSVSVRWRFVCSWNVTALVCWFFTRMRKTRLSVVHVHWRSTYGAVKWRSIDRKLAMHNKKVCCYEVGDSDVSSMFCPSTFSRIFRVFIWCSCTFVSLWSVTGMNYAMFLFHDGLSLRCGPDTRPERITHRSCVHKSVRWSDTAGISAHTFCLSRNLDVIHRNYERLQ